MQKVLIISYFFSPSNFVGGERTGAWAKHLAKNGVYPIIVTRQWNENQTNPTDKVLTNQYKQEKFDNYEVHRLPYKYSWRDRCAKYQALKIFQKALTLWELVFSNFFISALPYKNFYSLSKKIIKSDKDIKAVIISGRPFHAFHIGSQLKKNFPNLLWIPDYRDEWTTHPFRRAQTKLESIILSLEKKSEKKWLLNADFILSVSTFLAKNILKKLPEKQYFSIMNGFSGSLLSENKPKTIEKDETLRITYAGTLYSYQNIELVIESIKKLVKKGCKIKMTFVGIEAIQNEKDRVISLTKEISSQVIFINKIPKSELFGLISEMDLVFLTSYDAVKDWYPVKLFEYFASKRAILLCPSDNGVMEEFIRETNSGYIAKNIEECEQILLECIAKKEKEEAILPNVNYEKGEIYSREYQTELLAQILLKEIEKNDK